MLPQVFKKPPSLEITMNECVRWGFIARKDGNLALENYLFSNYSGFSKKAIQLIVDGYDVEQVKNNSNNKNFDFSGYLA